MYDLALYLRLLGDLIILLAPSDFSSSYTSNLSFFFFFFFIGYTPNVYYLTICFLGFFPLECSSVLHL
jgi:hypothetical protein